MAAPSLKIEAGNATIGEDEFFRLRQFWAQMMLIALDDCKRGNGLDRHSARRWLMDDSPRRFGFVWVCGVLDLDPEAVRERIGRMPMRVGRGFRKAAR